MKKVKISNVLGLVVILFLIFSCADDGEMGPQGEQGPQGEEGPKGDQGIQGDPGSANVIYSAWFKSGFGKDIETPGASFSRQAPSITEEIFNSGIVLVYAKPIPIAGNRIYSLPYTHHDQKFLYSFYVEVGNLFITARALNGGAIGNPSLFEQYRYVIIPGEDPDFQEAAEAGRIATTDYASMSYEEIASLFNIPD